MKDYFVPVGLSNRHVHLSKEHIDILFGEGYELKVLKELSQPGQYAAEEKVEVVGPKSSQIMRVLGPARKATQVEVSLTDSFALGIKTEARDSGDIEGTPGATIKGPKGEVVIDKGVIIAARHLHMHPSDAAELGVQDKDSVRVFVEGKRGVVFENVLIRVHEEYALDLHLDTDEGNAALLSNGQKLRVEKYENK